MQCVLCYCILLYCIVFDRILRHCSAFAVCHIPLRPCVTLYSIISHYAQFSSPWPIFSLHCVVLALLAIIKILIKDLIQTVLMSWHLRLFKYDST